jgi:IS5 family transposase
MPIDPSLMTRWRKRIGPDVLEEVLKATVAVALETGTVKPSSLERVTVDTTVQPKAIAHPTDSRLYLKALLTLVGQAKEAGVKLRQSHTRLAKKAAVKASRSAAASRRRSGMTSPTFGASLLQAGGATPTPSSSSGCAGNSNV